MILYLFDVFQLIYASSLTQIQIIVFFAQEIAELIMVPFLGGSGPNIHYITRRIRERQAKFFLKIISWLAIYFNRKVGLNAD